MPAKSKKPKTIRLWCVHSLRDGELVCGPFEKRLAEQERDRLQGEQVERRAASPIRPLRISRALPESVEAEVLRAVAADLGREDLSAMLAKPPVPPTAAEANVEAPPTLYEIRPVDEPEGFDPHSDEPQSEQRARLLRDEEAAR
jgi:hypothetical protein